MPIPESTNGFRHAEIQYLGYPFRFPKIFRCGTHKTIAVLSYLDEILEIADKTNKKVVAYLSMGFEIHTAILGM
jgi:hydroxymethylglutaryl-CoA lyase